jgi:hypothetical protein
VLDPLAVVLLLASQFSFQRFREQEESAYEQDDGPLTPEQVEQIREIAKEDLPTGETVTKETLFTDFEGVRTPGGEWIQTGPEFEQPKTVNDMPVTSEEIDEWNRMLAAAEKAVSESTATVPETVVVEPVTPPVPYVVLDDDSGEVDYYMTTPNDVTITHTENGMVIEDNAGLDVIPVQEPVKAVAFNEEYLKVGDQIVHYKAHDAAAKNAYDAVARHESTYVQNEEQKEADTKWKDITSVTEDKYQEAAKKNQESN